jgi:hypothetical protein
MRNVSLQASGFRLQALDHHRRRTVEHGARWFAALLLALLFSGCMLVSGPIQSADSTPDGGNVYVSFVSADGSETRAVATNFPDQTLDVIVYAQNERGQMRIEILDPQGSVAVAVEGQAEEQTRPGRVQTNAAGEFQYRIRATGAQRGSFSILYQPAGG